MDRFSNFPFSPKSFPFFYGWVVVIVGTLGIVSSVPGQTMGVSVFTEHLLSALALSRKDLSVAYMAGTICSGLLLIPGGRLIDRFGVRAVNVVASIGLGFSLLLMASTGGIVSGFQSLTGRGHFAFSMGLATVCFLFIRFFGQGLMAMGPRVMIGRWFERRRGLAIGVSGVFTSFAFGSAPLFLSFLIERLTWRGTYLILAVVIGVGTNVVTWVFFRERPEDCGLVPDGGPDEAATAPGDHQLSVVRDFTPAEARGRLIFWVFALGLGSQALSVTAITFHITSIAAEAGVATEQALAIFLPISALSVVANLTGGWLSDKTKLHYLLWVLLITQAVGTSGFFFMEHFWGRALIIGGYGISSGLWGALVGVAWPRFFGLKHLGAITGLNMTVMVFSSSLGPYLLGVSFERFGSYSMGFAACLALPVVVLVASLRVRNPQEELPRSS